MCPSTQVSSPVFYSLHPLDFACIFEIPRYHPLAISVALLLPIPTHLILGESKHHVKWWFPYYPGLKGDMNLMTVSWYLKYISCISLKSPTTFRKGPVHTALINFLLWFRLLTGSTTQGGKQTLRSKPWVSKMPPQIFMFQLVCMYVCMYVM